MKSAKAKKRSISKTTAKLLFAGVLSFGIMGFTSAALAQAPPPPQAPPSPGELLKKINPFKKKKAEPLADKKDNLLPAPGTTPGTPPGAPPTPPNPIEAIKKIKLPKPPAHPGT